MKFVKIKLLLLIITIFLVSCSSQKEEKIIDRKIIVANERDVYSLDPREARDEISKRAIKLIYSTLFVTDSGGNIIPELAESYEITEDNHLIITLKKNIKFSNNKELKAEDVKFSLDRLGHNFFIRIDILNDYKLKISIKESLDDTLIFLSNTETSILNSETYLKKGDKYFNNPIGTGPYIVIGRDVGKSINLRENQKYFKETPNIKRIEIKNIPDENKRLVGINSGEYDVAFGISIIERKKFENNEKLSWVEGHLYKTVYLALNKTKIPLSDKRIREGLAHSINQTLINSIIYKKVGTAQINQVQPSTYQIDHEKAFQLFSEAGYDKGFSFEIKTGGLSKLYEVALLLKNELKNYSININVNDDSVNFFTSIKKGDYDSYLIMSNEEIRGKDIVIANQNTEFDDYEIIPITYVRQFIIYNKELKEISDAQNILGIK